MDVITLLLNSLIEHNSIIFINTSHLYEDFNQKYPNIGLKYVIDNQPITNEPYHNKASSTFLGKSIEEASFDLCFINSFYDIVCLKDTDLESFYNIKNSFHTYAGILFSNKIDFNGLLIEVTDKDKNIIFNVDNAEDFIYKDKRYLYIDATNI